jgi:hypothetical protein
MVRGMSSSGDDSAAPGDVGGAGRLEALGKLPASRQDRDRVVGLLRVAASDGRLTPAELDERLEAALAARTYADLAALTADLPPAKGTAAPAGGPAPPATGGPAPPAAAAEPGQAPAPGRPHPRRRTLRRWLTRCQSR